MYVYIYIYIYMTRGETLRLTFPVPLSVTKYRKRIGSTILFFLSSVFYHPSHFVFTPDIINSF